MNTTDRLRALETALGEEPGCDCGRPDKDAGHNPGCSWVKYMRGNLWMESQAPALAASCIALGKALEDSRLAINDEVHDIAEFETVLAPLHPLRDGEPEECVGADCQFCYGATVVLSRMSLRIEDSGLLEHAEAALDTLPEAENDG